MDRNTFKMMVTYFLIDVNHCEFLYMMDIRVVNIKNMYRNQLAIDQDDMRNNFPKNVTLTD